MHGIFQISEAFSLALHGMGLLAKRGRRTSVKEIARVMGVSEAHLAKVFQRLAKSGLVASMRGPKGGFVLAKPAEQITLYDIYKVVEGELAQQYCLLTKDYCPFGECLLGGVVQTLTEEFSSYLRGKTLAELTGRENDGQGQAEHHSHR